MKRGLIAAAIGIVAVIALAGFGFGRGMMHRGMFNDPKKLDNFITYRLNDTLDDLKATPQQRSQILAIKDRLMPDIANLMQERKAHKDELKQLWLGNTLDAQTAYKVVDQRAEEMRQLGHKIADGVVEAHKVLTPAQRAQLAERMDKMHKGPPEPPEQP